MFSKILIANRGEIACRVIRTARRMNIATVAIFSDVDRHAMHVELADEAVHVGPSQVSESYLRIDRIIEAALGTGAEAIHPGYGFLSENPDFVEAVEAAGITFIGPSAEAIRAMGLKDAAKRLMEKAGVPVVPGYHGEAQELVILAGKANEIGFPVLIKARAGGGGKGMRLVERQEDFPDALSGARREAKSAFGDDRVLVEKYIEKPRHIEVQVFGDKHGNAIHLFERDCSLQRRHQKVIEEAPAPGMPGEVRAAMTEAAVTAAKAIGYSGAGTIEFIVDGSDGLRPDGFWFMEMNTRLQVEHPVTEFVTGIDLVEWQFRVAAGEAIPRKQEEIRLSGHAFEARLYAEDAEKGFLPATGTLHHLRFGDSHVEGTTVRVDTGVRSGDAISPYYDPMIAKIVAHGPNRPAALAALKEALRGTEVAGTVTNRSFLANLAEHEGFATGEVDTGLIARDMDGLIAPVEPPAAVKALAALAAGRFLNRPVSNDPWVSITGYGHFAPLMHSVLFGSGEENDAVHIAALGPSRFRIEFDGLRSEASVERTANGWRIAGFGAPLEASFALTPSGVTVYCRGDAFDFRAPDPVARAEEAVGSHIAAPMPGLVKVVRVTRGASVRKGQQIAVLEAMKMEHSLTAPRDAVVAEVRAQEGAQVREGMVLVTFEES